MTTMTFAPGWTQTIDTDGPSEKDDLLSYISDTYKGLYGFRPRGHNVMNLKNLRDEARSLERDVMAEVEYIKKEAARKSRDKAAHKKAMKYYTTLKPRSNAMSVAMLNAKAA